MLPVLVGLALVGCSGRDTDVSTATTAPLDASRVGDLRPQPLVEVLEAGEGPRVRLRLSPRAGTVQPVILRQSVTQEITSAGKTTRVEAPEVAFNVSYDVAAVANEQIFVAVRYGGGRVGSHRDPSVQGATRQVVEALESSEGNLVINPRGSVLALNSPVSPFPPELAQLGQMLVSGLEGSLSVLTTPFPDEAVGVGAKWRVTTEAEISQLSVRVTAEVELTALDEDSAEATSALKMTILPGTIQVGDVEATVEGGELEGGGTMAWDLGGVVAFVDQRMEGTANFSVEQSGRRMPIKQFQRQHIVVEPR